MKRKVLSIFFSFPLLFLVGANLPEVGYFDPVCMEGPDFWDDNWSSDHFEPFARQGILVMAYNPTDDCRACYDEARSLAGTDAGDDYDEFYDACITRLTINSCPQGEYCPVHGKALGEVDVPAGKVFFIFPFILFYMVFSFYREKKSNCRLLK